MPVDYSKYPKNWLTEIRPRILKRDENHCKFCGIKNHEWVIRGRLGDVEAFQDEDGIIYDAETSKIIGESYVGDIAVAGSHWVKVVLTVAHLNHDITDNRDENLAALCQRCHNRHDAQHRKVSRKEAIERKKGLMSLFGSTI